MANFTTLTHVIQRAFQDSAFLQALMKEDNVDMSLKQFNLTLTEQDLPKLKAMLEDSKKINGREFLELVNSYNTGISIETKRGIPV
ncbi:MAG: hypothetical protein KDC52_12000, partial [Ignavibacteriae bacterium]|nr:hypothetical protein [Ignavibacteriota bacterium]